MKGRSRRTAYILENEAEFSRLERQSRQPEYDFVRELQGLVIPRRAKVLDAGCGSGIVTRFLAESAPDATVVGCDVSANRVEQARKAAESRPNIRFETQDVLNLTYKTASFDVIVCRYVVQHLRGARMQQAVSGLARCLKPGGVLRIIDGDGMFSNLYPMPPEAAAALAAVENQAADLHCGRKIPALLHEAGLEVVHSRADAILFTGEPLKREVERMRERLRLAAPALSDIVGGALRYRRFVKSFLAALQAPGSCYYHTILSFEGKKRSLE